MAFEDAPLGIRDRLTKVLRAEDGHLGEPASVVRDARALLRSDTPNGDDISWMFDQISAAAPRRPQEALIWARITQEACRRRSQVLGRISGRREQRDLRRWLASAQIFEGRLLLALDSASAALAVLEEVLAGGEVDDNQRTRAEFYVVRARSVLGDPDAAEVLGARLAEALVARGNTALAAETLDAVGAAYHRAGRHDDAGRLLAQAMELAEGSGSREEVGRIALASAQVAAARGDHRAADAHLDLARSAAAQIGEPAQSGRVEEAAATILATQDRLDDAIRMAERAILHFNRGGEDTLALRAQLLRARLLRLHGEPEKAAVLLGAVAARVTASQNFELVAALEVEQAATH